MKKIFVALSILLLVSCSFGQGTQWSNYPRITSLFDNDVIVLSRSLSMKSFLFSSLRTSLRTTFDTSYVRRNVKQYISGKMVFTDSVSFRQNVYFNRPLQFTTYSYLAGNIWLKGSNLLGQWEEGEITSYAFDVTGSSNIFIQPASPQEIDTLTGYLDNQVLTLINTALTEANTINLPHIIGLPDDYLLHKDQSITIKRSNALSGWVLIGTSDRLNPIDSLNVKDKFIVDALGNIVKWRNKVIEPIPTTDTTKVLYSNGKWKAPSAGKADTSLAYTWTGLHQFTQDSIKINSLWYDFPTTRIANSVLYDSLGNGILKWKPFISGSSIDTTKISYLAKNETYTGNKTFNGNLTFGTSSFLYLPIADAGSSVGYLWRSTNVLKYNNSAGATKTLATGTGTTNEMPYWADANTLGSLPTASYPSLTELSYVKGVTSSIQTQINGKQATLTTGNLTETVAGLQFDATRQVIGGAATLSLTSGYSIPMDTSISNWRTAYAARHWHSNKSKLDSISAAASRINSIPSSYVGLSGNNDWTGFNKFTKSLLAVDSSAAYFNAYTATSGADIKGLTSYVYTSSNPTANKIYGGYFRALGSGTSGGSTSYGIYAEAAGSNTNYAGYFVGDVYSSGTFLGNLSGNAGTVTNGVYTNGSYSDPSWIASLSASKITQSSSYRFVTDAEKSIWNGKQAALNGTGFVKMSGTTVTYDNSTYATTNTTETISGEKTFSAATGSLHTKLSGYNSTGLTSDANFIDYNGTTSTSGVDIIGVKSVVSTSSNPTANKIYGGYFAATGSGTSGGSASYGIYASASGSNTNYAAYFVGNEYLNGDFETTGDIKYGGDEINPFEDLGSSGGTIDVSNKTNLKFTYYSGITITSFNGYEDGKVITIYNDGTSGATVTINETGNIITPGSSIVLGRYDTATFKYVVTGSTSKWICTSYIDN